MNEPNDVSPASAEPVIFAPPEPSESEVEVAAVSEKGPRDENQDWLSWVQSPRGELFIVADGLGGYKGGAHASRLTVEHIEKHIAEAPPNWPFARALEHAVRLTNREVHRLAHSGNPDTENMGSTVVVALVADGKVQVGHVGDSRAYLFRDGRLRLLTRDHTRVQQMVEAKMLTARQARDHPEGHVLTRAIGSRPEVEIEVGRPIRLKGGDALLMCSDGLTGFVHDKAIRTILQKQPDVQRVPGELVAKALASGGSDNVTIQFVRFGASVRERWTVKLPPAAQYSGPTEPPSVLASGRRVLAVAAALALVTGAAVAPLFTIARPEIAFTSEPDGGAVVLRWSAPEADELRIEPSVGLDVVPSEGTARVPAPATAPLTYTATAAATIMWWTLTSETTVTIQPQSGEDAHAPVAPGVPAPMPQPDDASPEAPAASPAGEQPPVPVAGAGSDPPGAPADAPEPAPPVEPPDAAEPVKDQPAPASEAERDGL